MDQAVLDRKGAAKFLGGISERSLDRLRAEGRITAIDLGLNKPMFRVADLVKFIEEAPEMHNL